MIEHSLERSRFAMVMRGYDRHQVDAALAEYERWAGEAQTHMEQTEERIAEATRRAEALETKMGELEERANDAPRPSLQLLEERVDQLLDVARHGAADLLTNVETEAHAEREDAARATAELEVAAQARVAEIAEATRGEQEARPSAAAARREADRCIEEGRAEADERVRAVWDKAEGPIHELRLELERLEERRHEALEELARLRGSLEDLVRVS